MMISFCHRFDGFDVSNHNCVLKALSMIVDFLATRSSSALKSRLLLIHRALHIDIIDLISLMHRRCVCFQSDLCRLNESRVFRLFLRLIRILRLLLRRCCVRFQSGLCRLNESRVFRMDLNLLWVFDFGNKLIFIGWHCNYVVCGTSVIQLHLKIFFLLIFHNLDFRSFMFLVFLKHLLQLSGLLF